MSKKSFVSGLDSLLQETKLNSPSLQETNKTIKQARNKEINIASKEKATFNLSKQLLHELEQAWIDIRKERGKRITKTDIVEFALGHVLTEFKSIKQESKLYFFIKSNNNTNSEG